MNNLIGCQCYRLTVIDFAEPYVNYSNGKKTKQWLCKCDCGKHCVVRQTSLTGGVKTKSCGCLTKERMRANKYTKTHGQTNSRLYDIWKGMRKRCYNINANNYKNYGGRGISICNEWESFEVFNEWASINGYTDELTIERIDNNKDYSPDNCSFISLANQMANRRTTHFVCAWGETKPMSHWAKDSRCKVRREVLRDHLKAGWEVERAISTPPTHLVRLQHIHLLAINLLQNSFN